MKLIRLAILANTEVDLTIPILFSLPESITISHFRQIKHFNDSLTKVNHDLVLIDNTITNDLITCIISIINKPSNVKIIVITEDDNIERIQQLIHLGVSGIVLRSEFSKNFSHFIRTVLAGKFVISPEILTNLLSTQNSTSQQT